LFCHYRGQRDDGGDDQITGESLKISLTDPTASESGSATVVLCSSPDPGRWIVMAEHDVKIIPIDRLDHPKLIQLYRYWDSKRAGRRMPSRSDIDPLEIPKLLPHLILLEVHRDPYRFRYRLAGSHIGLIRSGLRVRELTGHWLDDVDFDFADKDEIMTRTISLVERGEPAARQHPYAIQSHRHGLYRQVALPLSSDGVLVDMLLIGVVYEPGESCAPADTSG